MRELVTDGLVAEFSNSETNHQSGELTLAIRHRRAAQMFPGAADGDRRFRKLGKALQRALNHLQGAARQPAPHQRREADPCHAPAWEADLERSGAHVIIQLRSISDL